MPDGTVDRYKARLVEKGYNQIEDIDYLECFSRVAKVSAILAVKEFMHQQIIIKDFGHAKYFLGIEIARSDSSICLGQRKFILNILHDCKMLDCIAAATPLPPGFTSPATDSPDIDPIFTDPEKYRRFIGLLLFLGFCRPDICYDVQQLGQHLKKPFLVHWDAASHVLCYPSGCPNQGLFFPISNGFLLNAFSDNDYAKSSDS
ncbi:uncharacterized mitochondrial protein AtMg00810-like [Rutidosis leptorrhynchoides]|uniref:uncharacterized mitochondrial protein AtMg00810-like n=1 Tax=Rutidosis leptorrhynchoides TaxID=125765 RepID=UPI003A9933D1